MKMKVFAVPPLAIAMHKFGKYMLFCIMFMALLSNTKAQQKRTGKDKKQSQPNVRVDGNISHLSDTSVIAHVMDDNLTGYLPIKQGKFQWITHLSKPQKVYLTFLPSYRSFIFYADMGTQQLLGYADTLNRVQQNIRVQGSALQNEFYSFSKSIKSIDAESGVLDKAYSKASKEQQKDILEHIRKLGLQKRDSTLQYIRTHTNSLLSLELFKELDGYDYHVLESLYKGINPALRTSPTGLQTATIINGIKVRSIGEPVLNFSLPDTTGKIFSIASAKGKYVFIDFWASWCSACRAENPNVLKAYQEFKNKNFTVVGVSIDANSHLWKKAIIEDGMPWVQLLDTKRAAYDYYQLKFIPWNILIDPQGNIVAKDLRGEALSKKLSELFNKQ